MKVKVKMSDISQEIHGGEVNPSTITVSLETARKLAEAGYDQPTVFVWANYRLFYPTVASEPQVLKDDFNVRLSIDAEYDLRCGIKCEEGFLCYPAPTCGEIPDDNAISINGRGWDFGGRFFTVEVEARAEAYLANKQPKEE